jgi:hypothetical protein
MLARETFDSPHVWHNRSTLLQEAQKGRTSLPPTSACQDAPFPGQDRSERRGEAYASVR